MGKSQTKKKLISKERRHNPLASKGRVPDSHLGSGQSAASNVVGKEKEEAMLPILRKLQSTDPSERGWSCAAITNIIQNDPATRRLLQGKNVVGILIERLTDSVEDVIVEASGALRNLAIDGGYEICGEMYNKNIMTPLTALVPKITATIQGIMAQERPVDQSTVLSSKLIWPLAENVVSLFWCLSEVSNKVLLTINAANLVPFLSAFIIHRSQIPINVVTAAAQCLYALSFDNRPFKRALTSMPEAVQALQAVLTTEDAGMPDAINQKQKGKKKVEEDATMTSAGEENVESERVVLVKVLVAGILRNVLDESAWQELDMQYILPLIRPLLNTDLQAVAAEVTQLAPQIPDATTQALNASNKPQTDHRTPAERQMDAIERRLSTLMVALEVITNVCAGLTDDMVEDEDDWVNSKSAAGPSERRSKQGDDAELDEDDVEDDLMDDAEDLDEQLIAKGRNPQEQLMEAQRNAATSASSASTSALLGMGLHLQFMALAASTPLSYPIIAEEDATIVRPSLHPPTTSLLSAIHLRSLEALNNLLLTVASAAPAPSPPLPTSVEDAGKNAWTVWTQSLGDASRPINEIWTRSFDFARDVVPVPQVIGVRGQEIRRDVLDMVLGVMMDLAKIAGGCGFLTIDDSQLQSLISAFNIVQSPTSRSRIILTLSYLAMRRSGTIEQTRAIGDFMLQTLQAIISQPTPSHADAEVAVAALNAIFDIFADERSLYDQAVFRDGQYLTVLSSNVKKVRSLSRGVDKRKDQELRVRAEEAYENLVAFIQYRRSVV